MTLFASPPAAAAAACDVSAAWALQCTAFDAPASNQLRVQADVLVCVNAQGVIEAVLHQGDPRRQAAQAAHAAAGTLRSLPAGSYLLPGMVDLHVHAPQWPQNGKALDVPLEVWLQDNTFPLEARYRDPAFAQRVYDVVVPTLLANGTTTAMYFGTVDNAGNQVLAERCLAHGQRALVGRWLWMSPRSARRITKTRVRPRPSPTPKPSWTGCVPTLLTRSSACCPSSPRALFRLAPTRCCKAWAIWPSAPVPMCKRIAPKATGPTAMCWRAPAPPMRMRYTALVS